MKQEIPLSNGVTWIAWGYCFLHFHINLGTLDILPDWLGYWMMFSALGILGEERPSALLLRPLEKLLIAWSAWEWANKLFDLGIEAPVLSYIIFAVSLYFHFQLLTDLAELASAHACPQHQTLLRLRTIRTVLITLFSIPWSFPQIEPITSAITLGLALLGVIVGICIFFTIQDLSKALADQRDIPEVIP